MGKKEYITIINTYVHNSRIQKIYEAKTDRTEGRNRQFNNNSWRLEYPLSIMDRTTR